MLVPGLVLMLLLALYSQGKLWRQASMSHGLDYYQLWFAGAAAKELGLAELYSPASRLALGTASARIATAPEATPRQRLAARWNLQMYGGRVETTSTPFTYATFGLLRSGRYDFDALAFLSVSLLASASAVLVLARWFRYSLPAAMAAVALAGYSFSPLRDNMAWGNVVQVQLALLVMALAARRLRHRRASWLCVGFCLGVAVLLKPNIGLAPAGLVVWLLLSRRVPQAIWTTVGGAGAVAFGFLVTLVYFGQIGIWGSWLALAPSLASAQYAAWSSNLSLPAVLWRASGIRADAAILLVFLAGMLAAMVAARRRRPWTAPAEVQFLQDALVLGTGVLVGLLSLGLAWPHYYTLTILLLVPALRPEPGDGLAGAVRRRAPRLVLALGALVILSMGPGGLAGSRGRHLPWTPLVLGGALLLLGVSLWDFLAQQPPGPAERAKPAVPGVTAAAVAHR